MSFRSGFACLLGRPNTGKSTLTNALVGTKVAIMSDRPQTTRHAIRGIVHRPDAQLVLVDTPGFHRPRTLLGQRLNDLVLATISEVDVVGLCVPADREGRAGRPFHRRPADSGRREDPGRRGRHQDRPGRRDVVGERLLEVSELGELGRGRAGQCGRRLPGRPAADLLLGRLPEGPPLYPDGDLTDSPEEQMAAELIREAALSGVRDELPHSIAIVVEEMRARAGRDDLLEISAVMYVERDSQKGIVIGVGGQRLRDVGTDGAQANRGAARHPGLPRPAGQGREGLAARPEAAAEARLLAHRPASAADGSPSSTTAPRERLRRAAGRS